MNTRIIQAYDKDGNVIAWSELPRSACMPVSDETAKEIYKRQTGAVEVKIL